MGNYVSSSAIVLVLFILAIMHLPKTMDQLAILFSHQNTKVLKNINFSVESKKEAFLGLQESDKYFTK